MKLLSVRHDPKLLYIKHDPNTDICVAVVQGNKKLDLADREPLPPRLGAEVEAYTRKHNFVGRLLILTEPEAQALRSLADEHAAHDV